MCVDDAPSPVPDPTVLDPAKSAVQAEAAELAEPVLSESSSNDDGNARGSGGHSGSNGNDGGDESNAEGDGDEDGEQLPTSAVAALGGATSERARTLQEAATRQLEGVGRLAASVSEKVKSSFGVVLHSVPAQVLVALISMASTLAGARLKMRRDKELAKVSAEMEARKRTESVERSLRKTYADLAAPILKSAAKLAERLHLLVAADWTLVEKDDGSSHLSAVYSAYLLGRYLAMVEILKRERALLDYGFPAADRILANILGRVQGVFSANDKLLQEMQLTEHLFQPGPGEKPLRGGLLRITPRAQAVLGELLLRKLWLGKYNFVDAADEDEVKRGPRAVVSFLEFSRLLAEDKALANWYNPVVKEFEELEATVRRVPWRKRRKDAVGARLYFVQSGLLDLVEFFDPLPHAQSIPFYRRRRLQLGKMVYEEEQRAPMSLHLLYNEVAHVRDHRVASGNAEDRLKLPGEMVEVHVKASPTASRVGEAAVQTTEHGDCPYSQRVLIVLEELGVVYKKVFISAVSKPAWFYLLHPENRTPVVYHNGRLVEDSKHIVGYLLQRFPERSSRLGSAEKLRLDLGTAAFTRFHSRFLAWLVGDERQRVHLERELRLLDATIGRAQVVNDGEPFLGGCRFAREDTAIAPMLNNVDVAGRELKRWGIPNDCKALRRYLNAARLMPSFVKTVGKDEAIVAGYREYGVSGGERIQQLADMLE